MILGEDRSIHIDEIIRIATIIVLETPKRSSSAGQSYVRRSLIANLESELRQIGRNIDVMRERMREIEKAGRELAVRHK